MVTCHIKPRKQGETGGIVEREAAMYASKVQVGLPQVQQGHPRRATRSKRTAARFASARSAALNCKRGGVLNMAATLKEKYIEVAPALFKKFGYKSAMQIPKIDKVVVNVGCGEARENAKVLEAVCSRHLHHHRPEGHHHQGQEVRRELQAP